MNKGKKRPGFLRRAEELIWFGVGALVLAVVTLAVLPVLGQTDNIRPWGQDITTGQFKIGVSNYATVAGGASLWDNTNSPDIGYASGNVGIGTNAPLELLHVEASNTGGSANAVADDFLIEGTSAPGLTILSANTSSGAVYFADPEDDDRGGIIYDHIGDGMNFFAGGSSASPQMTLNSNGFLGISELNPLVYLHVVVSGSTITPSDSPGLIVQDTTADAQINIISNVTGEAQIAFGDTASSAVGYLTWDNNTDSWEMTTKLSIGGANAVDPLHVVADTGHDNIHLQENSGGENWQIGIDADGDLNFEDEGTVRVTFEDGGQVGIGIAAPSALFHVDLGGGTMPAISANTGFILSNNAASADDVNLSLIAGDSDSGIGEARINFGTDDDEDEGSIRFRTDLKILSLYAGSNAVLYVRDGAFANTVAVKSTEVAINDNQEDVNFRVETDTNANALFVDAGLNRVGLFDSTPSYPLDVNGTIRAQTDLRVDGENLNSRIAFSAARNTSTGTGFVPLGVGGSLMILDEAGFVAARAGSIVSASCTARLDVKGGDNETVSMTVYVGLSPVLTITSSTFTAALQTEAWSTTQAVGTDTYSVNDIIVLSFGTHSGSNDYSGIHGTVVFQEN